MRDKYIFVKDCPSCGEEIKCYYAESRGLKKVKCCSCNRNHDVVMVQLPVGGMIFELKEIKEKYRFIGNWGLKENKGKTVIKVHDINPWEFRGYFEGQQETNTKGKPYNFLFVFQYKDVKRIGEEK